MKKMLFLILISLCGCSGGMQSTYILGNVTREIHKEMENEFGLKLMREVFPEKRKITRFTVDYLHDEECGIVQARFLIHKAAKKILSEMNNSLALRAFLENYPVGAGDVEISVYFSRSEEGVVQVTLLNGELHYYQSIGDECFQRVLTESFL